MGMRDDFTPEECAAIDKFQGMSPLERATTVLMSVLADIGRVADEKRRLEIIAAALTMHRAELVLDYAKFALNSGIDLRLVLAGTVQEATRRRVETSAKFAALVSEHMHYGETIQ